MEKRFEPLNKLPDQDQEEPISHVTLTTCIDMFNKIANNEQVYSLDAKTDRFSDSYKTFKIQGDRDQLKRVSIDACWRTFHEQQDNLRLSEERFYIRTFKIFREYEGRPPGALKLGYSKLLQTTYQRFVTDNQDKLFVRLPNKKEFLVHSKTSSDNKLDNSSQSGWEIRSFKDIGTAKYKLKVSNTADGARNGAAGQPQDQDIPESEVFKCADCQDPHKKPITQISFIKGFDEAVQETVLNYIVIYSCRKAIIFDYKKHAAIAKEKLSTKEQPKEEGKKEKEEKKDEEKNPEEGVEPDAGEDEEENLEKEDNGQQEPPEETTTMKGEIVEFPDKKYHLQYHNSAIISPTSFFTLKCETTGVTQNPITGEYEEQKPTLKANYFSFDIADSKAERGTDPIKSRIKIDPFKELPLKVIVEKNPFKNNHEKRVCNLKFIPLTGSEEIVDPKNCKRSYLYRKIIPATEEVPSYISQISFELKQDEHQPDQMYIQQRVLPMDHTEGTTFFKSYHRGRILVAFTFRKDNHLPKAIRIFSVDHNKCHQMFLLKADFYDPKWSQIGYDELRGRLIVYEGYGQQLNPFDKTYQTNLHFVDFRYYLSESNEKGKAEKVKTIEEKRDEKDNVKKIQTIEPQNDPEVVYKVDLNLSFGNLVNLVCTSKAIYYSMDDSENSPLQKLEIPLQVEKWFSPIFIKEEMEERGVLVGFNIIGIVYFGKNTQPQSDNAESKNEPTSTKLDYVYLDLTKEKLELATGEKARDEYCFNTDNQVIFQLNRYVFFQVDKANQIYMYDTYGNNFSSYVEFTLKSQVGDPKKNNQQTEPEPSVKSEKYLLYEDEKKSVDFDLEYVKRGNILKISLLYKNFKNRITSLSRHIELTLNKNLTMTLRNKINGNLQTYNYQLSTNVFDMNGNCFVIFNKDESRLYILDGDIEQLYETKNEDNKQQEEEAEEKEASKPPLLRSNSQNTQSIEDFAHNIGNFILKPPKNDSDRIFRYYLNVTKLITIITETGEMYVSETLEDEDRIHIRLYENSGEGFATETRYFQTTIGLTESGKALYIFNGKRMMAYSTLDFKKRLNLRFTKMKAPTSVMGLLGRHYVRIYFFEGKFMYRYKKIISIPANKMGILSLMLEECGKETDPELRRELVHNIGGLSRNVTKLDETYNTLMLIMFLELNDKEDFIDFVKDKLRDLIIYNRLLEVFVFYNEEKAAWQYVEEFLTNKHKILPENQSKDLRFDFAYIDTVSTFMRKFVIRFSKEEGYGISMKKMIRARWRDFVVLMRMFSRWVRCKKYKRKTQDKGLKNSLSSELVRRMIHTIFMVDTENSFMTEMKNKVYPVHRFKRLPHSIAEESDQVTESLRFCSETFPSMAIEYKAYRTLFDVDYVYGSDESRYFFNMISRLPVEDLVKWYKPFFYMRFDSIWYGVFYWALIDWANTILCYIVLGRGMSSQKELINDFCITIIVLVKQKMLYEFICMATNWWNLKYWSVGSNYLDLASQVSAMYFAVYTYNNPDEDHKSKDGIIFLFLKLITMLWLLIRSVTWFRVFRPTRYLVTMITVVFKEIFFFVIFMAIFVLTYAYCWRTASLIASIQKLETGDDEMNFYASLLLSLNIVFGNAPDLYEDGKKTSIVQTFVFVIGNIAIGLAYMNFLIAIISGVHDNVQTNQHIYDVKEIIHLLKDYDMYYYGWRAILVKATCGMCKKKQRNLSKRYVIFLPTEEISTIDDLHDRIDEMTMEIKSSGENIASKLDLWTDELEKIKEETKTSIENTLKKGLGIKDDPAIGNTSLNDQNRKKNEKDAGISNSQQLDNKGETLQAKINRISDELKFISAQISRAGT